MSRPASRRLAAVLVAGVTLVAAEVSGAPPAQATPTVEISTLVEGLTIPWDITWVGDLMVFDERGGQVYSKRGTDPASPVSIPLPDIFAQGEAGLLGLVADPDATTNGRFYTCQAVRDPDHSPGDVRVLRWRLTDDTTAVADAASPSDAVVVRGLPLNVSGRHSGCRLRFGPDGMLYVGTGDAAKGTNPQNLKSLGGKVLRVRWDGHIPRDNPFYSRGGNARYVWNYGHRNVQGLAVRPGTSQVWSAEHGTRRDDEINQSLRGRNYGWDPIPGYNEDRSMTDRRPFPAAVAAKWKSGSPTIATSGLTFLTGPAWGRWEGAMAAGLLAGKGIMLAFLDPSRRVSETARIGGLESYGRIRTVQQGPDGALYFTTSNGGARDVIGKIMPSAAPPRVAPGERVADTGVAAARTGSQIWAFAAGPDRLVRYRRSTNDGRTWGAWRSATVTSTVAPAAASSKSGRIDLVTLDPSGTVVHTWFSNGRRAGQKDLGQTTPVTALTLSSTGGGLDIFALTTSGTVARRHLFGTGRWSDWRDLGGAFTGTIGAGANVVSNKTVLVARGPDGEVFERSVTWSADGSDWVRRPGALWSGRALGAETTGRDPVGASVASDGYLAWWRGDFTMGVPFRLTSEPAVVTRSDGSWLVFGRGSGDKLYVFGSRSSAQKVTSLGGTVG